MAKNSKSHYLPHTISFFYFILVFPVSASSSLLFLVPPSFSPVFYLVHPPCSIGYIYLGFISSQYILFHAFQQKKPKARKDDFEQNGPASATKVEEIATEPDTTPPSTEPEASPQPQQVRIDHFFSFEGKKTIA